MVDAAIGGKTGIDLPQGKNLVGLFHAPRLVLSDPDTLKTLPKSEIRAGMAEVVKAGIIADKELFGLCQAGWRAIEIDWSAIISRAVAVKIKIIQADPYDHGLRAALNFGHTVGHALEKVSGFSLLHGLAVSMGMVGEARIAERLGLAQKGLVDEITEVLIRLGLPVLLPASLDPEQVYEAMFYDKKKSLGKLNFALPIQIGEVKVGVEVTDKHLIINALKASQS
jgi:3-dehydroquinate synthetase